MTPTTPHFGRHPFEVWTWHGRWALCWWHLLHPFPLCLCDRREAGLLWKGWLLKTKLRSMWGMRSLTAVNQKAMHISNNTIVETLWRMTRSHGCLQVCLQITCSILHNRIVKQQRFSTISMLLTKMTLTWRSQSTTTERKKPRRLVTLIVSNPDDRPLSTPWTWILCIAGLAGTPMRSSTKTLRISLTWVSMTSLSYMQYNLYLWTSWLPGYNPSLRRNQGMSLKVLRFNWCSLM